MSPDAIVREQLLVKDALMFNAGDALDTKASIVLVVVTFLSAQTAWFVTERHVEGLWLVLQAVSATALVASGVAAIIALWPRDYLTADTAQFTQYVSDLAEFYHQHPPADGESLDSAIARVERKLATERILTNTRANEAKAWYLVGAFRASALAFALNLATVAYLTVMRLS